MANNSIILFQKQAGLTVSLFCVFLITISCSQNGKVVATVDDVPLYENDVLQIMKHQGYDLSDSILFNEMVDKWCIDQAFINELENQDNNSFRTNQLRAHSFIADLARFEIEKISIQSQLDTLVSDEEINQYYEQNKEEFILQDYIVKALYLKIPKSIDFKKDEVHKYYLLKNDKDLVEINAYAKSYAENYYFNDSTWIFFNELVKDIPISKYNVDNIILNRSKTYFSDDNFTYFINVIDFKLKNEVPPIDFLRNDIRRIILTKRLLEITDKNESVLIQRIKTKHEIIIKL